MKNGYGEITL